MPAFRPILPPPEPLVDDHDALLQRDVYNARRRRRWRLLFGLLTLAAIAGIALGARPALHQVKAWQARRLASAAVQLTNEGKLDDARTKVQDALAIWRLEPEAIHAAAFFLTRAGAVRSALGFWEQLDKTRALSSDDLRDYAWVELALGEVDAAESMLHRVWRPGTEGTRADWLIAMQIALRRGRAGEACAAANRILADPTAPARERLNAAAVIISSRPVAPEDEGRAWETVSAIAADGKSQESLAALILIAQHHANKGGSAPLDELIVLIDSHPLARAQHHLVGLDLLLSREPGRGAELVQNAIDRFGETRDDGELATLAAWLYGKGEYDWILKLLPADRAVIDRALYLQYLDTLAALGRWTDIRTAIQARKFPLDPMLAQMFLARCASQLGESAVRDARWQGAIDAAGNDPDKLIAVGQYAAKNGASNTAVSAFEAAIKSDPDSRAAHQELVRVLEGAGDTDRLRAVVTDGAARWPYDRVMRNDSAYLDALLGEKLPEARNTAREYIRAEPGLLAPRVTLALAELRQHHAQAALDAFSGYDFARGPSLRPREAAVYAAVLWETSFLPEAVETSKMVPVERLLPEERKLIMQVKGSSNP